MTRLLRCGAVAGLAWATPLAAQSVHGRLVATSDESGVGGALVQLLDSTGAVVARAASSPSGGFAVNAPRPGRYRVVVRRIGQRAWHSAPLELGIGATLPLDVRLAPQPYTLPEITVAARRSRCGIGTGSDDLLGRLLDAAATALGAAEAAAESRDLGFSTDTWVKRLAADFTVEESTATDPPGLTRWPIRSADPDSLRTWGFVRDEGGPGGPVYYGPDARVMFSTWFLGEHCFSVTGDADTAVVVRFEPEQRGHRGGLAGRLEIDRRSLELRSLTFEYLGLPRWVPKGSAGGEVRLRRLPGGAWVPYTWTLRAPVPVRVPGRSRPRLHGWMETGGRVTAVHGRDGRRDSALTAALLAEEPRARRH